MRKKPTQQALVSDVQFTQEEYSRLTAKMLSLLAEQTGRYTMGDSTSVTTETAQELLDSLWYTLSVVTDAEQMPPATLLQEDLRSLVKRGQDVLQTRLGGVKRLWETVCRTAPQERNVYYTDTLREIGNYTKQYDLHFFAHRVPAGIDYPLLCPVSERLCGLDFAEQYLKCLLAENALLHSVSEQALVRVWRAVAPDYRNFYMNQCDQPLTNAVGLAMLGKNPRTLLVQDADRAALEQSLLRETAAGRTQRLDEAVDAVCRAFGIADGFRHDYIAAFADSLMPRLEVALHSGNLTGVFVRTV